MVFVLRVSGRMREAMVHGVNLTLDRTIETRLGAKTITIRDGVANAEFAPVPLLLMYHMNFGYPLLSPRCRVLTPSRSIKAYDAFSGRHAESWATMHEPVENQAELCYFHDVAARVDGVATVALVNEDLGIGIAIDYRPEQLPCFTQWEMLKAGEYVLGLEPGNCNSVGRAALRRENMLPTIAGGEKKVADSSIRVLDGDELARI